MKILLLGVSLFVAVLMACPANAVTGENLDFSGTFETRTALGFKSGDIQKSEFILTPEISFSLSDKTRLTVVGRIRGDLKDQLEPGSPADPNRAAISGRLTLGDGIDAEIREAYLDTQIGSTYLRLGKQQIVWGQADGLKVLDVLNPQSFREFILDDFDNSRIPLWSVNVEVPVGDFTLQLVWIPDTTYNDIPAPGALYAFTSTTIVPSPSSLPNGVPVTFQPLDKPSNAFSDSDVGLKLSAFVGGWDLSLNYAYHYQDIPVVRRTVEAAGVVVRRNYERSHLLGGTFSNVFADFTLRGELGFSTDKWFQTADVRDADGVVRSDEFAYVLGLDYSGFTDWFISAQILQSYLSNTPAGLVRGNVESNMTLLIKRDFMNETVRAEALLIQSLNTGDGSLQLSVDYDWKSNITLRFGADIFYGTINGLFGQFRDTDRVTLGVELSF